MFKCGPTEDGETTSYGYDAASQLTSEVRPGYSAGYTFDGNGNRLSKAVNGVTEFYSYDDGVGSILERHRVRHRGETAIGFDFEQDPGALFPSGLVGGHGDALCRVDRWSEAE